MTSFSELGLPPAIAEAITLKKFETATPVQAAVMNPELKGRDLLVSSQTGSGKTLAFGAVLARELLSDEAPPKQRVPRALVIAPTRELATQVRGELAWLFAKTGWRMGVFTGGTDIWGDLRTLKTGVDVVVGTPGRLVDLVTREALSLATVEAVVLDEADEMLDMGFREDLEKLLGAASSRRLSLLFSATLPADILGLARRYQKNAVRIDTKASGAASHADIHYDAYLTAPGEKFPAVMNILRMHDVKRAIVFGTTRDGVASMHEALVARGVKAVVLSGERSQADRNRALATLKRGEASVLVATNVAARGLDLPEVDLVIHADLPSNVEALTHRSGRTGRAGRKGTSVIVAQLTERRKAERLMSMARLQAPWQAPPDANAVAAKAEEHLVATLAKELGLPGTGDAENDESEDGEATGREGADEALADAGASDGEGPAGGDRQTSRAARARRRDERNEARVDGFLARLGDEVDREALLRALVARELARLPSGDRVSPVHVPGPGAPRDQGPVQTMAERRARFAGGTAVFRINIGQRQNAEPGWLLPLICRRGGVTRKEVGAIRLGPNATEFEIASDAAEAFARAASAPDPRAPDVRIERTGGVQAGYGGAPAASHGARRPTPTAVAAPARATKPKAAAAKHAEAASGSELPAAASPSAEAAAGEAPVADAPKPPKRATAPRKSESADDVTAAPAEEAPATGAVDKAHKKPFTPRPAAKPSSETSYGAKPFGAKPYGAKPFGEKPYARKPYGEKPHGGASYGEKPFARKPYGEKPFAKKPYGDAPHGERSFGRGPGPRESFAGKPAFARKPFERSDAADRPARPSFEGTRPSFARGGAAEGSAPRAASGAKYGEKFGAAKLGGRSSASFGAPSALRGGDRPVSRTRTAAPVKAGRSRPGPGSR